MITTRRNHQFLLLCMLINQTIAFQSRPLEKKRIYTPALEWNQKSSRISAKMATRPVEPSSSRTNYRDLDQKIVRLGRSGKTDDALALYNSVERPTVRLMNSAIDACARARPTRLKQAFNIFETGINDMNLRPNVFSFGALMNACNRDRNSYEALSLLRSMEVSAFHF